MSTLPAVSGQTFTKMLITLDGFRYEKCKFIDCTIRYSGGPAEISSCEFGPNTVWDFCGHAGQTVILLQQCGWDIRFGSERPVPIDPNSQAYKI